MLGGFIHLTNKFMNNNNSGVNTILLVVILVAIVAAGVWYFKGGMAPADDPNDFNVNVELPSGEEGGSGEQ